MNKLRLKNLNIFSYGKAPVDRGWWLVVTLTFSKLYSNWILLLHSSGSSYCLVLFVVFTRMGLNDNTITILQNCYLLEMLITFKYRKETQTGVLAREWAKIESAVPELHFLQKSISHSYINNIYINVKRCASLWKKIMHYNHLVPYGLLLLITHYKLGFGHTLNGKSSGTVYPLIFERHFITLVCQLIGLDA